MYEKHKQLFDLPDETKIWKYLDLFKYFDLINNKKLFLLRADKYSDPYEGLGLDKLSIEKRLSIIDDDKNKVVDGLLSINNFLRKSSYVNCWHINEFESSVMWEAYSNSNGGLVIESTVGQLKKSIVDQKEVFISEVKYGRHNISLDNAMYPLIHKREEFQDERELRIFVTGDLSQFIGSDTTKQESYLSNLENSIKIEIDCEILISKVLFHPLTPEWVAESIKGIIMPLGSKFIPEKSGLYKSL